MCRAWVSGHHPALSFSGSHFVDTSALIRLPDDCTVGYIIECKLGGHLQPSPLFHSHLETLQLLGAAQLLEQVSQLPSRGRAMVRAGERLPRGRLGYWKSTWNLSLRDLADGETEAQGAAYPFQRLYRHGWHPQNPLVSLSTLNPPPSTFPPWPPLPPCPRSPLEEPCDPSDSCLESPPSQAPGPAHWSSQPIMSDEHMSNPCLVGRNCSWDRLAWLVDLPASPTAWPEGLRSSVLEFGVHVTESLCAIE